MNEQESWLLLHSPTIPFRIHNKHGKVLSSPFSSLNASSCSVYVSPLDGDVNQIVNCVAVNFSLYFCGFFRSFCKQLSHVFFDILQLFLFLCIQSYLFLLSSDYERSEWKESIQKLQKKGNTGINIVFLTFCKCLS